MFKNLFKKRPVVEEPQSVEEDSTEIDVNSLGADRITELGGKMKAVKLEYDDGVLLGDAKTKFGGSPLLGKLDDGDWMVQIPGGYMLATLVMMVAHNPVLCETVNSMIFFSKEFAVGSDPRSALNVIVSGIVAAFEDADHGELHEGPFRPVIAGKLDVEDEFYAVLSNHQVTEMAVTVADMMRTRPSFHAPGLDALFEAVGEYWGMALDAVGAPSVMSVLGDSYEGKA